MLGVGAVATHQRGIFGSNVHQCECPSPQGGGQGTPGGAIQAMKEAIPSVDLTVQVLNLAPLG